MSSQAPAIGVGFGAMLLRQTEQEVLLGLRNADPAKAKTLLHGEATWTFPGGKLHFGESFEEGVYRETLEETGILVAPSSLRLISITNNIVETAHFVTIGFLCTQFSGDAQTLEPDEITTWKWFPLSALPHPLYVPTRQILENFTQRTIYQHHF